MQFGDPDWDHDNDEVEEKEEEEEEECFFLNRWVGHRKGFTKAKTSGVGKYIFLSSTCQNVKIGQNMLIM